MGIHLNHGLVTKIKVKQNISANLLLFQLQEEDLDALFVVMYFSTVSASLLPCVGCIDLEMTHKIADI